MIRSALGTGMLRQRRWWIGMALSAAFIALFFYRVDVGEMVTTVTRADYRAILPAISVYFLGVWLRTLRWQLLLQPLQPIPRRRLFSAVAIGYMANNVLPARIGEIVRAYVLHRREAISITAVLATIVVERMFDGLALLLLMGIVALTIPLDPALTGIIRLGGVIFLGTLGLFLGLAHWPELARRLAGIPLALLPPPPRARGEQLVQVFLNGLASLRRPQALAGVIVTSVLAWLAEATMYFLIAGSFEIGKPFAVILVMTAVANLGTSLPAGPGGLGTFDALTRWTLTLFGTNPAAAAAYTVVLHGVLWLPITLVGFYCLWRENLALARITRPW